ncbi:hypothetical protein CMUS01_16644 [Colletotrichum musicola]|uniref:Uncharacterized protein n=1 Tax=Colletotrichum musicola TaxID=2175873 RepID=A0A8H6IMB2_9PEZI|nr:hypothetical protein CMUS01_16644 [Colletotrichum musicola]
MYTRNRHRQSLDLPRDSSLLTRSGRPSYVVALSRRGRSSSIIMIFSETRHYSLVRSSCTRHMVFHT